AATEQGGRGLAGPRPGPAPRPPHAARRGFPFPAPGPPVPPSGRPLTRERLPPGAAPRTRRVLAVFSAAFRPVPRPAGLIRAGRCCLFTGARPGRLHPALILRHLRGLAAPGPTAPRKGSCSTALDAAATRRRSPPYSAATVRARLRTRPSSG